MKENRAISPIIYEAVEILRKSFGGTNVKILSKEMYRLTPDEYSKAGRLGVDIEIEGIKVFFGCESNAESILEYGQHMADQFIFDIMKKTYPENFNLTLDKSK